MKEVAMGVIHNWIPTKNSGKKSSMASIWVFVIFSENLLW